MDRGAMTEISGNNLGFLMGDERSPRQMVEFLKEGRGCAVLGTCCGRSTP